VNSATFNSDIPTDSASVPSAKTLRNKRKRQNQKLKKNLQDLNGANTCIKAENSDISASKKVKLH
jgi:hypothetical protein